MSYNIILVGARQYALIFNDTINGTNSGAPLYTPNTFNLTLVSSPIPFRYRVTKVEVSFRDDTQNLLRIYIMVSGDNSISTIGAPPDFNLLTPYAPSRFLLGEGEVKRIQLNYVPEEGLEYIKVHATNPCGYPQTINAIVSIEAV